MAAASVIALGSPRNTLINYPQCEQISSWERLVCFLSLVLCLPIFPPCSLHKLSTVFNLPPASGLALHSMVLVSQLWFWWTTLSLESLKQKGGDLLWSASWSIPQGIDILGHLLCRHSQCAKRDCELIKNSSPLAWLNCELIKNSSPLAWLKER